MAAPRPAGLAWGQSFHHFYERPSVATCDWRFSYLTAGRRSLLATEAVPSAALRTVSISRHTASLNRLRHVQFQCRQTYCPNRKNGRGRKILHASEFFRFYSSLRADCWRQGLPYVSLPSNTHGSIYVSLSPDTHGSTNGSLPPDTHGSTYAPFSLSGSRWTMTWVEDPKACLIFCSMAVAWRWAS